MDWGIDTLFEMTLGAIARNGFHAHMIVAKVSYVSDKTIVVLLLV